MLYNITVEPSEVVNLVCVDQQDASILTFSWLPSSEQERVMVDYLVEVQQYVQPDQEVKTVALLPLEPVFTRTIARDVQTASVGTGVGK